MLATSLSSPLEDAAMADEDIRLALERHWAASEAGDYDAEHAIYDEDAVLEYPQSRERFRGRRNIQAGRAGHPAKRHFVVKRILGAGDLWVTEYVITYDEKPTFTVSLMEFRDGKVQRETQYFGDPFEPPAWRGALGDKSR
jgi:ketosteroid isomerase-like protein